MSLTRKLLKELNLPEEAIERIIDAHVATTDALKTERDALRTDLTAAQAQLADLTPRAESAARLEADFTAYREKTAADFLALARQSTLRAALLHAGANPQAVDLLAAAATPPADAWDGARLADPALAIDPLREQYSTLFQRPMALPTPRLAPPADTQGLLTRADVSKMSEQDILANWSAVQTALRG